MTTGVACPVPVLRFCDNRGNPAIGGSVLTQVGGVNTSVYQDVGLTTPLPNPVPLNSRGEVSNASGTSCQMFLTPNTAYTFTLSDANGNQLWQASYVDGATTTQIDWKGVYYDQTAAEAALSVTPTDYYYPPYTALRYGADPSGGADSTAAIQTAGNCAAQAGYAIASIGIPGAKLKMGLAWTLDTTLTGFDFQGAYIDASGFTTGNWFSPLQSNTDVNQRPLFNGAHPIKNATILGPGSTNTTAIGLYLSDPNPQSGTYNCSGMVFENLNFLDWGQDIVFNNGAFCINFSRCQFGSNGGSQTTYSVTAEAGSNGGERNTFAQCFWFNKAYIIEQNNGNGETFFSQCSFDGAVRAIYVPAGVVVAQGCHLESAYDTDYWVYVTGTNSAFKFTDLTVVADAVKTKSVFYSDSTCTWGGVYGQRARCSFASGFSAGALCAGTGNCKLEDYIGLGTAAGQPQWMSDFQQEFQDPDFTQNSLSLDSWTAANGAALYTGNGYNGSSYSVQFSYSSGSFAALTSRQIPCRAGEQAFASVVAQLPTFTAGASLTAKISYLDAGGNALTSVIGATTGTAFEFMDLAAQSTTYTRYGTDASGGLGRAPTGTVAVQLLITAGGAACTGYVGECKLSVA